MSPDVAALIRATIPTSSLSRARQLGGRLQMPAQQHCGIDAFTGFEVIEDREMLAAVDHHALMAEGPIVIAEAAQPVLLLHGDQKITVAGSVREALMVGGVHLIERDARGLVPL